MDVNDPEKLPVMDLPAPVSTADGKEQGAGAIEKVVRRQGTEKNPEFASQTSTNNRSGSPGLPAPVATSAASSAVPSVAPTATVQPPDPSTMPQIADDIDLIEKEWVEKAKQIVEKTKDDPRTQTAELDKVKIEYRKKRFNQEAQTGKGK